eukprot:6211463-Pleurochrysis_carterae.AAC.3
MCCEGASEAAWTIRSHSRHNAVEAETEEGESERKLSECLVMGRGVKASNINAAKKSSAATGRLSFRTRG